MLIFYWNGAYLFTELFSGLSASLVARTKQTGSNRVTAKKSSSVLIYQNKDTDIYTENDGID